MSYILDALKKSDQERQQGAGPSLQTIHRPHHRSTERGWLYILSILVLVLILALIGLSAWYLIEVNDRKIALPAPNAEVIKEPQPLKLNTLSGNSQGHTRENSNLVLSSDTSISSAPAHPSAPNNQVVIPFSELPLRVRNAIPSMTFSFHVYSDNPERRTIIINGRRVKQGAAIDNQLMLNEITPNGVIFSWQDYQFSIPVVEAW